MTDEELEQQDKQEGKEEHEEETKKTLKTVVISVICTLLFVIILLLLAILGLKKCSTKPNTSSPSEPEPTWPEHNNTSLNDVFKIIINNQIIDYGFDDDTVSTVIAVSCADSDSAFTLDITAYSTTKVYYYKITNYAYTGSDNFVDFLLGYDFNTNFVLDGTVTLSLLEQDANQTITTTETNEKHIISKSAADKYLSGYYMDSDNKYHVYQKLAVTDGSNPYTAAADSIIDYNSDLYGYYRFLNA